MEKRRVRMQATWQDTGNTIGDLCYFPADVAANLVGRGLAVYVDEKGAPQASKAKAKSAPPVDKMVRTGATENKEALPPVEDEAPKPAPRRRRRVRRTPAATED